MVRTTPIEEIRQLLKNINSKYPRAATLLLQLVPEVKGKID